MFDQGPIGIPSFQEIGKIWLPIKLLKVYHLFSPEVSGAEQYREFKETVELEKGDLPPILDTIMHECDLNEAAVWLNLVAKEFNCTPIVYSDENSIDKISKKFPHYNLC